MKFLPFNTTKIFFLYEKVRFKVLGLVMLMNQELYVIVSENQFNNLNITTQICISIPITPRSLLLLR